MYTKKRKLQSEEEEDKEEGNNIDESVKCKRLNEKPIFYYNYDFCFVPYEVDTSLRLELNYWVRNRFITDADIRELLVDLIVGERSPGSFIAANDSNLSSSSNSSTENVTKNVVLAVHGTQLEYLRRSLNYLPFLSTCSSVPVRHVIESTGYHFLFEFIFISSLYYHSVNCSM